MGLWQHGGVAVVSLRVTILFPKVLLYFKTALALQMWLWGKTFSHGMSTFPFSGVIIDILPRFTSPYEIHYSLQVWWYVRSSKSTSANVFARHKRPESQIETNPCSALTLHAWFHIPWFQKYSFLYSSNVCSHVGQSMHVADKQISFSITYLLPSKLQLFWPLFFQGKIKNCFRRFIIYILWLPVFVQREA